MGDTWTLPERFRRHTARLRPSLEFGHQDRRTDAHETPRMLLGVPPADLGGMVTSIMYDMNAGAGRDVREQGLRHPKAWI